MLTNKHNTPDIMMDVIDDKPYLPAGGADYSATSLIEPPQKIQLNKRYGHQIVDDALDRWNLFLGSAVHEYIEKELSHFSDKYILERKFTDIIDGKKVVAKLDAYDVKNDVLYDHKTGKSFAYSNGHKKEWEEQLNINAWFLNKEGIHPKKAYISMLTLDWMMGMARFKGPEDYPQNPMYLFDIPLWSEEEQLAFIKERLAKHMAAEELKDEDLPQCTEEEMWAKPSSYAVKKKGVYVAKRVLPTLHEAEDWMAKSKIPDLYIEERKGERTRCEKYCRVNKFCKQYQKYLENK